MVLPAEAALPPLHSGTVARVLLTSADVAELDALASAVFSAGCQLYNHRHFDPAGRVMLSACAIIEARARLPASAPGALSSGEVGACHCPFHLFCHMKDSGGVSLNPISLEAAQLHAKYSMTASTLKR
jgi:hypothetical protein